jgi:hypothetical protein
MENRWLFTTKFASKEFRKFAVFVPVLVCRNRIDVRGLPYMEKMRM